MNLASGQVLRAYAYGEGKYPSDVAEKAAV